MGSHKDRYKKGIPNDLDNNDPDFDLDDYIHENSIEEGDDIGPDVTYRVKKKSTSKRDRTVIAAVLAIIFLWYFDWNPGKAFPELISTL